MKSFFYFLLRSAAAMTASVILWLISFINLNDHWNWLASILGSAAIAIAGGGIVYYGIKQLMIWQNLKFNGLTWREYKLVKKNLKEAKPKLQRLQKAVVNIHSLPHARKNIEMLRVVRKIYSVTQKEPGRFFKGEEFYYSHLDSLVELAEKYAFLSSQPAKNKEINQSLFETRRTITELTDTIKQDLYHMLEGDMDTLKFELDVAKRTIDKKNNNQGRFPK